MKVVIISCKDTGIFFVYISSYVSLFIPMTLGLLPVSKLLVVTWLTTPYTKSVAPLTTKLPRAGDEYNSLHCVVNSVVDDSITSPIDCN